MATSARIDELRKKFDENPRRYFAPLANEYRKAGDPEQAVFICEEYLPQQPGHMSGHIVYGQALFDLGRYDDSRAVFETALSLDPENLIALRHLGDIARQAGDAHAARAWYQRVLEADPRNEEIGQLMMSLLATPVGTPAVDSTAPTPLSTPAVAPSEQAQSPTPSASQPAESEQPAPESLAPRTTSPSLTPVTPPSPQSFVSRHAPSEDELLDLDSFDLGGIPLSSLRNAKPETESETPPTSEQTSEPVAPELASLEAEAAHFAPVEESFAEPSDDESFVDAPFGQLAEESEPSPDAASRESAEIEKSQEFTAEDFEPDALAIAARPRDEIDAIVEPPPGEIELATDIALGLPDDESSASGAGAIDELETFEAGIITGRPSSGSSAEAIPTESFFDSAKDMTDASNDVLDSSNDIMPTDVADETFLEEPTGLGSPEAALVESGRPTGDLSLPIETTPEFTESSEPASILEPESEPDLVAAAEETPAAESETPAEPETTSAFAEESFTAPPLRTPQFERAIEFASPPPPLPTPHFLEAVPFEPHGDPLRTPAFGIAEPVADAGETPSHAEAVAPVESIESVEPLERVEMAEPVAPVEVGESVDALVTPDSAEAELHVPAAADATDGPGAFVNETMATLYLEQGHYDAAIDIYRQLVAQRPDDIALRDRLHAAEERAWGHEHALGASILDEDIAAAPAPRTFGGPTIRDFLTGIFYRRSMTVTEEVPLPVDEAADVGAPLETPDAASETAEAPSPRANATPSSGDSVGSSLGALFSEADAAATADEPHAESALGGKLVTPNTGTPAHRATNELSLDHVFKANTGRAPSDQSFSFDQFFSEGAAEPASPNAEPASEARPDSSDDIAQFNAWLNGLKKP
jgi:tetratricopeptide (TPR) repeat protein